MEEPRCERLKDLLNCETRIIQKHIDEHKWLQKIPDYNTGVSDFVTKYGWLMRELFCGYACEDRENCHLANPFKPSDELNPPEKSGS